MNVIVSPSPAATITTRKVTRMVRGMPASDGDGVKMLRVLGQPQLQNLDPFLMLDAFGSDSASDYIGEIGRAHV